MKKLLLISLLQLLALTLTYGQRGAITYFNLVDELTAQEIADQYSDQGIPPALIGIEYGADVYKVKYETIDYDGSPVLATGVVAIPNNFPCDMAICTFGHGLTLKNGGVATGDSLNSYRQIAMGYAANGFICPAPDYIRHGPDGEPGIQAFMHAKTEAAATIDLVRATQTFCTNNNIPFSDQLFVTGYSQGGHSSMATAKEIQEFHSSEFNLVAAAPGGGTFDLSGIALDSLISPTRTTVEPHAFGLITRSYLDIYTGIIPGLNYTYEGIYKSPYDSLLLEITDRTHPNGNTSVLLPIPSQMLEDTVLDDVLNDLNHPIRQALADNDLYDWTPQMPLNMYHCGGDIENPMDNVIFTQAQFEANGSTSTALVVLDPDASHRDCAQFAIIAAKNWFLPMVNVCSVGIEEQNDLNTAVKVLPNPFTESGMLDLTKVKGGDVQVKIYDAQGRLVRDYQNVKTDYLQIDRGDLPKGMYFLETIGEKRGVTRFVVQ